MFKVPSAPSQGQVKNSTKTQIAVGRNVDKNKLNIVFRAPHIGFKRVVVQQLDAFVDALLGAFDADEFARQLPSSPQVDGGDDVETFGVFFQQVLMMAKLSTPEKYQIRDEAYNDTRRFFLLFKQTTIVTFMKLKLLLIFSSTENRQVRKD